MKQTTKFAISACVAIFVLGGILAFQGPTQKFGVVNTSDVAEKSKLGQREKKAFDETRTRLSSMMQFLNSNKVIKRDDVNKIIELWRTEKPTAEQTKQLETLKTDAQKNSDELRRLISILNPSADEQAKIRELSALAQNTEDLLPQLGDALAGNMQQQANAKQQDVIDKARAATKKYGAKEGFTLIFEAAGTPYGANDVTDAVLKVMDTDNP